MFPASKRSVGCGYKFLQQAGVKSPASLKRYYMIFATQKHSHGNLVIIKYNKITMDKKNIMIYNKTTTESKNITI